jgi:Fuc2NAc and GlcNAc transferase
VAGETIVSVVGIGVILLAVFAFAVVGVEGIRRYAHRRDILDVPNQRSSHVTPTPRGGGAVIAASWVVAVLALGLTGWLDTRTTTALLGALPIAFVGWMDDVSHLPPRIKLAVQFVCACWTVLWLGGYPAMDFGTHTAALGLTGSIIAVIGLVWLTNLYNFMDGIDGIAGIEALTAAATFALVLWVVGDRALALSSAVLCAAASGFLTQNWPPAKIFMGDVGSLLVGFALGATAIAAEQRRSAPALLLLMPLAVFVCDSTYTLLGRAAKRERLSEAHKSHVYQRLVQRGWSHLEVTVLVLAINIVLAFVTLYGARHVAALPFLLLASVVGVLSVGAVALRRGLGSPGKRFERELEKQLQPTEVD